MIYARQLMSQPVVTIGPEDSIRQAIALMLEHAINGLPVIGSNDTLLGILTEGDLLRRAEIGTQVVRPHWLAFLIAPGKLADEYTHSHSQRVGDVMTSDVVYAAPSDDIATLATIMQTKHFNRIPIVESNRMIGVVGRANLLRAILNLYTGACEQTYCDSEIRSKLWLELNGTEWAPCRTITIGVSTGVVTLGGIIPDGRERRAIVAAAQNIPGVLDVQDHMTWIDLNTGSVIQEGSPNTVSPGVNGL